MAVPDIGKRVIADAGRDARLASQWLAADVGVVIDPFDGRDVLR